MRVSGRGESIPEYNAGFIQIINMFSEDREEKTAGPKKWYGNCIYNNRIGKTSKTRRNVTFSYQTRQCNDENVSAGYDSSGSIANGRRHRAYDRRRLP